MIDAKKIAFFFDFLKYRNVEIAAAAISMIIGSNDWSMIFETKVRAGFSIDCINKFVAVSIVMLIVAMEY